MLEFDKCFNNNIVEDLKEKIKNMQLEGCVNSFINYVNNVDTNDKSFENIYRSRLLDNYQEVILNTKMQKYENMSKEDILKVLRENIYDESACINNDVENYDIHEVFEFWPIKDIDAFEHIKKYMIDTLDELIKETNQTDKEEKIEKLKQEYRSLKKQIDMQFDRLNQLNNIEKELVNLNVNIENL